MPFCNLIGHERAKTALSRMVEQQAIPNTLLFSGPGGTGKAQFALAFACLLMGKEHRAKVTSGHHPDVHIYFPEGKSYLHPVDAMRQLVEEMGMPPFEAPVKVFIIHDAHQMLPASSNTLLKTFEEPNLDSYIILLSDQPELLLSTIVSRCRRICFFPIPHPLISEYLVNHCNKSQVEANRLALLSQGSLGKALELSTDASRQRRQLLVELLSCNTAQEYPRFIKLCIQIEESLALDSEENGSPHREIEMLFEEIIAWYRDLHLISEKLNAESLYYEDFKEELKRSAASAQVIPLENLFDKIQTCQLALQRHVKLRNVLEWLVCL